MITPSQNDSKFVGPSGGRQTLFAATRAIYTVLEKGLQTLRGYITHLNGQESHSQHMSRNR
jgi:hypothetical protein